MLRGKKVAARGELREGGGRQHGKARHGSYCILKRKIGGGRQPQTDRQTDNLFTAIVTLSRFAYCVKYTCSLAARAFGRRVASLASEPRTDFVSCFRDIFPLSPSYLSVRICMIVIERENIRRAGGRHDVQTNMYRLVQKKRTVLLSTNLAWPALAGCSRAETVSQLSPSHLELK